MSLSDAFCRSTERAFRYLVEDCGFEPPQIDRRGWQSTSLTYVKDDVRVRVEFDMEEEMLVSVIAPTVPEETLVELLVRERCPEWRRPELGLRPSKATVARALDSCAAAVHDCLPVCGDAGLVR